MRRQVVSLAILSRSAGMVCREILQRSPVIARVKHLPSGGFSGGGR